MKITATEFRTQIAPGKYLAVTPATVYLSHGYGDSRRDIEFVEYRAGDLIEVPKTTNGHWYGLEPNGDMFAPEEVTIETAREVFR